MSETQMTVYLLSMGFGLVNSILMIIAKWKIFDKAGEAGWKAIIPFVGDYTLFKIVWNTVMFWVMLALTAVIYVISSAFLDYSAAIVIYCVIAIVLIGINALLVEKLSNAFGHGMGYTAGLIFLPFIFYMILAFGNSQYIGKDND